MTVVRYALIVAGLGLLAGCSSRPAGEAPGQALVLQDVNDLLHATAGTTGRVPARLADMTPRVQSLYPRGYEAVKSGAVVVLWGAPLKGEGEAGKDEAVVAYEKAVPADGGYVLLSAGTVKKMSAAEFTAAPKAGTK
ncbi:MAG TPA: hypothetical protein VFE78_36475 [Gemmataceae bacterium]|jgi:hypothetical protein|nr:hypothetical protein [Gemmataceae bacterium]